LASLAGAFSSGASAVAVIVAEPSSEFALLLLLLALLERVRGVRCDISILLYAVYNLMTAQLSYSPNGSKWPCCCCRYQWISAVMVESGMKSLRAREQVWAGACGATFS
jgi:hypothetical protein